MAVASKNGKMRSHQCTEYLLSEVGDKSLHEVRVRIRVKVRFRARARVRYRALITFLERLATRAVMEPLNSVPAVMGRLVIACTLFAPSGHI